VRSDSRAFAGVLTAVVAAGVLASACGVAAPPGQAAARTAPAETTWRELGSWSGRGSRQTESFEVTTGALRVRWEAANAPAPDQGALTISLHSAISGRVLQTPVDQRGVGASVAHLADEPRTSYLGIESADVDWTVTLEEAVPGSASGSAGPVTASGTPVQSPAVTPTPMPPAARAELAPNGRLRAALNYGNFLLVSSRAPEHAGVAPDLARELAKRAGATVEFVGYTNAGLVADAAKDQAWDVAFIGAEPARADLITFTPAYVEIEATYIVPAASAIRSVEDVDRPGVRIASGARAAYTLYLQRSLEQTTVTEVSGIEHTAEWFARTGYDAVADLKPRLAVNVKKAPGLRMLDGRFTAVQQSFAVRKERAAAAAYLTAFGDEIKRSGLLRSLIEKHAANGLLVAK
jgi:polar amino acid transport system substrate-binding protein